jgi:hypothetical protein
MSIDSVDVELIYHILRDTNSSNQKMLVENVGFFSNDTTLQRRRRYFFVVSAVRTSNPALNLLFEKESTELAKQNGRILKIRRSFPNEYLNKWVTVIGETQYSYYCGRY